MSNSSGSGGRTTTVHRTDQSSVEVDPLETAKWTRYVPEALGMRAAVKANNYRWCMKESLMWGIATGTVMSFHRLRMGSKTNFAINIGMCSLLVVSGGSYYFCTKRRDYKERVIEMMMKLNSFEHASQMPAQTPIEEHPFQQQPHQQSAGGATDGLAPQEFEAMIKDKKEWQPREEAKSTWDVFKKKGGDGGKN